MRITRVLHTSVNVAGSTDDATSFYRDLLGLDAAWRPEIPGVPGAWFQVADVQLHLVGSDPLRRGVDPGAHHVCFGVDDLAAAVAALDAAGVQHVEASQDQRGRRIRQVWFQDPAGNVIELQQDPAAGDQR